MKRTLLLIAVVASATLQSKAQKSLYPNEEFSRMTLDQTKAIDQSSTQTLFLPGATSKSRLGKFRPDVYDFVQIGNSFYDLQTNASIGNRAMLHPDGTITMAWTFSGAVSTTWPDRGSGINYFDGTNWGNMPTARTENVRTGWPSIGMLPNGNIFVLAHDFDGGGIIMSTNTGKGKTDWTTLPEILNYTGGEPIWNRTTNNGDTMHVLTNFSGQEGVTDVIIDKITNPTTYSRSFDGGKTWVQQHVLLPGYDSTRYLSGGGDNYAITSKGPIIAVAIGGNTKDLSIWKSMDNGETWKKTIVDSFVYPAFVWGSRVIDQAAEVKTNDGSMDILIDNNDNVHVTFGRLGIYDADTTDEFMSVPQDYYLYHWSENFPTIKPCGSPIDMDNALAANGSPWDISAETTNSLGSDGNPANSLSYAARYGSTSISSHPSMGVDAQNRIFVTYDAPVELIFHDYNANFRDIHIVYSTDGGQNWSEPQNATQIRDREAVFACQTKQVNDFVHFIFQEDVHPGTNLQNNGNSGLHPNVEQKMQYAAIPVQDILDGKLGQHTLSAKPIDYDAKVFVVSQNYPNPFAAETNVIIYMRNGSELSYTISDASGKVVATQNLGYQGAGNHEVVIDGTGLSNGIYFYTLKTKDSEVTKKMNVVK